MGNVNSLTQYFTTAAIKGYVDKILPLQAFAFVQVQDGAALGDIVRFPFASVSASTAFFSYANGYNTPSVQINGKSATLSNPLYQQFDLTDAEAAVLTPQSMERGGALAGNGLGAGVVSASFSLTTYANYPLSASASGSKFTSTFTSSLAAFATLDNAANAQKWPDSPRVLVANTTLWQNIVTNTSLVPYTTLGSGDVAQTARANSLAIYGFKPYVVTLTMPALASGGGSNGFIATPNAMGIALARPRPPVGTVNGNVMTISEVSDTTSGTAFNLVEIYEPLKRTTHLITEVLHGCAVIDANALINIPVG